MLRVLKKSSDFGRAGFGFVALVILAACAHEASPVSFGLRDENVSYIPARIALLNCRAWPNGARYSGLPVSNSEDQDGKNLCDDLDRFMIQGFAEQPYMRGISPQVVAKLLARMNPPSPVIEPPIEEKAQGQPAPIVPVQPAKDLTKLGGLSQDVPPKETASVPNFTDKIDEIWRHQAQDCSTCRVAPEFYVRSIGSRPEWLLWLSTFSRATQNSDAVLIPFLTHVTAFRVNDRGARLAMKQAGIAILLIDTNNGNLLWSGGRAAEAVNRSLADSTADPILPGWQELSQRLLIEDLWKDFPGRQKY